MKTESSFFSLKNTFNLKPHRNIAIQNPERLIEDIVDLDQVPTQTKQFYIIVKDEKIKRNKKIIYEAKTAKLSAYIFTKLKSIMYLFF